MQHSYSIQNQAGAAFRADLNDALTAIVSNNSGATEPNPSHAFQWWADTTTGILKQRNAANNDWVEILDLATGRPVGAVAQTSPTGALLLAEGTDAQRPTPADIPAGVAAVRGNSTSLTDYFLELWNRKTEVWDALASRGWVRSLLDAKLDADKNINLGVSVEATGTVLVFNGFPSTAKRITLLLSNLSLNGGGDFLVQGGTSSGFETTGYVATANNTANANSVAGSSSTSGFLNRAASAANVSRGTFVFEKLSGNTWVYTSMIINNPTNVSIGAGEKTFAGALDRLRLQSTVGSEVFDSGTVSVSWE